MHRCSSRSLVDLGRCDSVIVDIVGALDTPLMLLGNVEPLPVRVDIDENDAWRVRPEAPAVAFMRGNREIRAPLQCVRFEPYTVPKNR